LGGCPLQVACEWIGNTAAIAAKHYLTVREEDFERASKDSPSGAKSGALEAQNQAQQAPAEVCVASQESTEDQGYCGDMQAHADGHKRTTGRLQVPGGLGTIQRSRKVRLGQNVLTTLDVSFEVTSKSSAD
jgi:hypothetical protein